MIVIPDFSIKTEQKAREGSVRSTYERIMDFPCGENPPFGTYSSPVAALDTRLWAFFFSVFSFEK